MRILYLTGGAGRMYCGSCLRDNAMATELIARKHDVLLLPVYTPTFTDEPNVSRDHVVLGGISAYLEQYVPLFRKTPKWLDRLWDSKFVLSLASRRSISTNPKMLGEMTVSVLKGEGGFQSKEIEKLIDWLKTEPPLDIINLPYTLLISLAKPLKEALNVPIVCTMQGEDLFLDGLQEPYRETALRLIRSQIENVDGFLSVSRYYAEFMPGYLGIAPEKIRVVPLGINPHGFELREPNRNGPFTVGFLGRVAPEKGLHVLAEAYRLVRKELPEARLEVAGYMAPDSKSYFTDVEKQLADAGLAGEFRYHGVIDRDHKIAFLRQLDVMSLPATYDEPKGVSLLEAMACGVPLVQPRRGAFTEIVESTGGGILVRPDDPADLAAGILKIARDRKLAEELGANGFRGVREHYSAAHMADRLLEAYASVRQPPESVVSEVGEVRLARG
ncbi:MAG TPA: glycosyltransferase family 4 protein [Pyrinomonadaceae bacterium]|nr:glycosyltransferase family 4 protein [Pyrinomonadaceae bacterium]